MSGGGEAGGPRERLEAMMRRRSSLIRRLSLFDANLWLGEAEGFPLARAMPLAQLLQACRHYGLDGALLSQWDGKTVSPQEGNRVLAKLFGCGAAEEAGELGLQVAAVWTGVPLTAGEEGPLPGSGKTDRIQGPVGGGAPPSWLAGVRLFPRSHNFPLSPWLLESLVQWLLAHGLPLFVWHEETDWDSLHALTCAFPELPVVVESQTRKILYHSRPLFALLEARPNLYAETSNLAGPDFVGHVVRNFGADRLIFGSFLPQNDPLAAIGMLLDAGISEAQMRTVAGGNLRRLLGRRGQAGGPPEDGPG